MPLPSQNAHEFVAGPWDSLHSWLMDDPEFSAFVNDDDSILNRRNAPQGSPIPYIVVSGPKGFDDGMTSSGTLSLKLAVFSVGIYSEGIIDPVNGLFLMLRRLMSNARRVQVGPFIVNNFMLQTFFEHDDPPPDGSEKGRPGICSIWKVAYYDSRR